MQKDEVGHDESWAEMMPGRNRMIVAAPAIPTKDSLEPEAPAFVPCLHVSFLRSESWYPSLIPETHTAAQSSYCAHNIILMLPSTPLIGIRRAAYCNQLIHRLIACIRASGRRHRVGRIPVRCSDPAGGVVVSRPQRP